MELEADLRAIEKAHDAYWKDQLSTLGKYRDVYLTKFWNNNQSLKFDSWVGFEDARGHSFIEQYVNGLKLKQPSVFIGADPTSTNNPKPVEVIVNRWLTTKRQCLDDATRKALLYPCAFLKICMGDYDESDPISILDAPYIEAIDPWDVFVDWEASSWDRQRYVAHRYYLPVSEAKEKYGNKEYRPTAKNLYFSTSNKDGPQSDYYKYVCIVEHYDLQDDRLITWTTNTSDGFTILADTDNNDPKGIPLRDPQDRPLIQLVPLYFTWNPDTPLQGLSTMARVYDKVAVSNIAGTYFSNTIRTNARKTLYSKELGEEVIDDLESNIDNQFIPVENIANLSNSIVPVPVANIPGDFYQYLLKVDNDMENATILAPTSRGEAVDPTKTATEINYMMSATGSELNKMSNKRDEAIQMLAKLYIRMLHLFLNDNDQFTIEVDGKALPIKKEHISSNFTFTAVDQGVGPIAALQKDQAFIQNIPTLLSLNANPTVILKELIKRMGWPEDLMPVAQPESTDAPIQTSNSTTPIMQGAY